jgi:hypothetical protein
MPDTSTTLPLPLPNQVQLTVIGRWGEGGFVQVRLGQDVSTIPLPPTLFAVLALLILKARHGCCCSADGFGFGFLSVRELCDQLLRRTRHTDNPLDPDPQRVAKYVFRLRRALKLPDLIAYQKFLGYHLCTPAGNLELRILDDLPYDVVQDGPQE